MPSNTLLAKIAGWLQFALSAVGSVATTGGLPAGGLGWLTLIGSLAAAVGIHAASNSPGTVAK